MPVAIPEQYPLTSTVEAGLRASLRVELDQLQAVPGAPSGEGEEVVLAHRVAEGDVVLILHRFDEGGMVRIGLLHTKGGSWTPQQEIRAGPEV